VDDEKQLLELLSTWLRLRGQMVTVAADAAAVEEAISNSTYDVVLMDVMLGTTNGIRLIKPILSKSPDAQIIMMSGLDDPTIAATALKEGAHDFLPKPFDLSRLTALLNQMARSA
jgi:DNA-binding NtrC family response regulator